MIVRKFILAVAMTGLFIVLSITSGFGCHVYSIREQSFVRHSQYGYADAAFYCDIMFDPILHPTYWLKGQGHTVGSFSMLCVPEGYRQSGPYWGTGPTSRYDTYIMYVVTSGLNLDLIYFFMIPFLVEISGSREAYVVLFSGIIGFAVATIIGMFVGLLIGIVLALLVLFRWSKIATLERLWRS
jgi:hypothetical protein